MSLNKKMRRKAKTERRKTERAQYKENREEGPCFVEGCTLNGDFITRCRTCDFKVQGCTLHFQASRSEAKKHVISEHPVKALSTLTLGVLRGQPLD